MFSQSYTLRIDGEGRDALPSKLGAIFSILLMIIMLLFTGYKISRLTGKKNVDIIQAVVENHYDDEFVFGGEQGLNIAVAVLNP